MHPEHPTLQIQLRRDHIEFQRYDSNGSSYIDCSFPTPGNFTQLDNIDPTIFNAHILLGRYKSTIGENLYCVIAKYQEKTNASTKLGVTVQRMFADGVFISRPLYNYSTVEGTFDLTEPTPLPLSDAVTKAGIPSNTELIQIGLPTSVIHHFLPANDEQFHRDQRALYTKLIFQAADFRPITAYDPFNL
jgi:hypothetical protein